MTKTSLNQEAWVKLFEKYDILKEVNSCGIFKISSNQIKDFREPRLMTKFDHSSQLPSIFREHNISILPLTRGSYALGRFNIFHESKNESKIINNRPKIISYTNNFETLDFDNITSETGAISCAYVSKILEDFLGEEVIPTVSGRMSSDCFQFQITDTIGIKQTINVNSAQIEIDAGYESTQSFFLLEAKNYFVDDFVIRQLYYPYRKWKFAIKKTVRNIFLTYSNGIFDLREYGFYNINDYNSIYLIKSEKYTICNFQINVQSVRHILDRVTLVAEPDGIPFPQADSFDRVINLCELLSSKNLTKAEITENYGFDPRQTDYYMNACLYLGLAKQAQSDLSFVLTEEVKAIFNQHIQFRRKFFIEQLLKRQVFNNALRLYLQQTKIPSIEQISEIMKNVPMQELSIDTRKRRASTVKSWIDWIVEQFED